LRPAAAAALWTGDNEADPRLRRAQKAKDDYMRKHKRPKGPAGNIEQPTIELRLATTKNP